MTNRLLYTFLLCVFSFSGNLVAQGAKMNFDIQNIPSGKAKLIGMLGEQRFIADSAVVGADGKFTLERTEELPAGYYYWLLPQGKNFGLLLDKGDQQFSMKGDFSDLLHTFSFENNLNTRLFYETALAQEGLDEAVRVAAENLKAADRNSPAYAHAKAKQDEAVAQREAFLEDVFKANPDAFYTKFKIAGQNPTVNEFRKTDGTIDTIRQLVDYRNRFWDNVDFSDERLLATPVVANKLNRYVLELTPQNPDSIIKVVDPLIKKVLPHKEYFKFFVNWIALKYENTKTSVMGGEAVFCHVLTNYFTDELAFWDKPENLAKLRKTAWEMEASLLNRKGPDVVAADILTGEMKSIYEIKEPIVVVFMYSPDCEHCQKDAPEIERIYQEWKSKGVSFYGIGVNTEADKLRKFVLDNKFSFPTVFDPTNRAIYAKYYVDITPELYVLDKDRTIVAKNLKPSQLSVIFEQELKKMR